ncbi:MAG: SMP-30/gluconolactonase/LRE family protein [Gammaproteobacteria bacterium]|nr:SMP-30/gluconolactonase/LRE family protein [Gammaproteobacteria bacterium]
MGPDGSRRLFVINHGKDRSTDPEAVELFEETAPGEFTHLETFQGPELHSPNDLVAVGPRQFYVANDKALGGGFAGFLQQFGIGGSPLTFFDGSSMRHVIEDIASGGGINASADGRALYVAETTGKRVRVLDRAADGSVTERMRVAIETSPDNIDVAEDGSLWVTGHANTLALIQHFINGTPAPTQVWRVALGGSQADSVEEVYLDDGKEISAGSVGATWNGLLLIGSITDRKILICERTDG